MRQTIAGGARTFVGWSFAALVACGIASCTDSDVRREQGATRPPSIVPTEQQSGPELILSEAIAIAVESDDPPQRVARAFEDNGFSADQATCLATESLSSVPGPDLAAAFDQLAADLPVDGTGAPIDSNSWTLLRAMSGCLTDDTAVALVNQGLIEADATCIANRAVDDEGVAVALALYSRSRQGDHRAEATSIARSVLATAGVPEDPSVYPPALLLLERADSCITGETGVFLGRGD